MHRALEVADGKTREDRKREREREEAQKESTAGAQMMFLKE